MLLILIALAALSGAVFGLGLIAGYEMSRQNQVDNSQLAAVYPAPSPEMRPTAAAVPPAPPAMAVSSPAPSPAIVASKPPVKRARVTEGAIPPAPAMAPPPPPPGEENADEENGDETGDETPGRTAPVAKPAGGTSVASAGSVTAAAPTAAIKRRPFNIQIDAVMDYTGAQQMAQKLRRLGYQPTIVQTEIAGQSWYRLRVGPYATQEDARAAQEKLRQQYRSAFGGE
jgi:septal ring-binding cell division protein DamX